MLTRRTFLKAVAALALAQPWKTTFNADARPTSRLHGKTLEGWSVVVGDGVYAAPGEAPVSLDDIATTHSRRSSLVQANIHHRRIMAHNITFLRVVDDRTLHAAHECRYTFRLPFTPSIEAPEMNGETVEGGLFVWDGANTRMDYGLAFQWVINPWSPSFGELRAWSGENGGMWVPIGSLAPDTRWHRVRYWLDIPSGVARLRIDQHMFELPVAATPKNEQWGTEIAARLQFEVISLYPGETGTGAMHAVEVRDWRWEW
ncbi:hypothetical protein ARMA_0062 [Ardenticatena maritima]|uniref:3-keto-disaccharide hydrolase domain-containing protein n=1 Tax=Ardenticatena maritima TaxID=872965 RepID=A0A0M8K6S7_9CHLR|nr:hypothetical protein [Ardenticatena maritima]KPL88603.1 hypothetical protein SE16_07555 [Ardenticatena maritima]GAP61639.1 hypothetical protein ARMA_0062 [Ardenticatena maritima]